MRFEQWKQSARKLKREVFALYLAMKDPRTPWYARVLAVIVIGFTVSPIDLVPDFIPVLGYLDDLILIPLGIIMVRKLIPSEVMRDCREQAASGVNLPKSRIVGGVILGVWIFLLVIIILLSVRELQR